jgi:hypothetical protein
VDFHHHPLHYGEYAVLFCASLHQKVKKLKEKVKIFLLCIFFFSCFIKLELRWKTHSAPSSSSTSSTSAAPILHQRQKHIQTETRKPSQLSVSDYLIGYIRRKVLFALSHFRSVDVGLTVGTEMVFLADWCAVPTNSVSLYLKRVNLIFLLLLKVLTCFV